MKASQPTRLSQTTLNIRLQGVQLTCGLISVLGQTRYGQGSAWASAAWCMLATAMIHHQ